MSTNVSLVDTPGVSVYFDGQPIQDLQEAELQREEERQAKELRHLLETELEDFEDDFLSGSNSEDDDTGNLSRLSGKHSGNSPYSSSHKSPRGGRNQQQNPSSTLSPLAKARGKSQSIPEGLNFKDDVMSRVQIVGKSNPRAVITEHQSGTLDSHGLSVSADNLVHIGSESRSPNKQGPGRHPHANHPWGYQISEGSNGLAQNQPPSVQTEDLSSPMNFSTPYINMNAHHGAHSLQRNTYNPETSLPQIPHSAQRESWKNFDTQNDAMEAKEACDVSDIYLNLPGKVPESADSAKETGQELQWGDYQNTEFGNLPHSENFGVTSSSGNNVMFSENGYSYVTTSVGNQFAVNVGSQMVMEMGNRGDDEWMMQIQAPAASIHPYPRQGEYDQQHQPSHLHHHQYHHLHQRQHQPPSYRHSQQQADQHQQSSNFNNNLYYMNSAQHSNDDPPQETRLEPASANHTKPQERSNEMRNNHLMPQHQAGSTSPSPPPLPSTSPPPLSDPALDNHSGTSQTRDNQVTIKKQPANLQNEKSSVNDDPFGHYKVHYHKTDTRPGEEEFYLKDDHIEFFQKDGPEDRRTYEQLEILYRARGREIEELTRKLEEKEEMSGKELRILKHKLAIATGESEGTGDSLRQCQKLLQQAKTDNSDANGKIKALEAQMVSLKDTKEELIKKLQTAESTIENLSHHIEELQNSESLSRARNEHDAMISSLTQRFEKELLAVKEKFDSTKAALESKQEELIYMKKQLADATHELEQAQISRGETINRLARSLEDSQKQCQALLEQSSSHEISSLKVQLQQSQASMRITDDLCRSFQNEIKELKEQLSMFESASCLGAFGASSSSHHAPSQDDSMTDLGIRKTLDFDTPQSMAKYDGTQSSDELILSLRSELERCLRSNKQKRSEVTEKAEEVKALREEVEEKHKKIIDLERSCSEQKKRLQEIDLLTSGSDGVGIIEARLRKDIENLKREKTILLEDIEDYKKRLEEIGFSEAKLTEINAELSHQITQMVSDFDADKHSALKRCQRTMEEVNRMSIENLRTEMEERFKSEKAMTVGHYDKEISFLREQLNSAQTELDNVKSLYIKKCEESAAQEAEFSDRFKKELQEELEKVEEKLEREKKEWERFMREDLAKNQNGEKETVKEELEKRLKADFEKQLETKITKAHLEGMEEERNTRLQETEEAVAEARKNWEAEYEIEIQKLSEEKTKLESDLCHQNEEIAGLKQKLDAISNEHQGKFHEDVDVLESEWKSKLAALEKQHAEEVNTLMGKFDKEKENIEHKLREMSEKFSPTVSSDSTQKVGKRDEMGDRDSENDKEALQKNLENMERKLHERENQLKELESEFAKHKQQVALSDEQEVLPNRTAEKDTEIERLKMKLSELEEAAMTSGAKSDSVVGQGQGYSESEINEYKTKIQELEEKLSQLRMEYAEVNVRSSSDSGRRDSSSNLSESDCRDDEFQFDDVDENIDDMKERIRHLESKFKNLRRKFERDAEDLKTQHRKEFEKAARAREEKFQSELRYFLKEREDKGKAKLEKAVRECEAKAKQELEKVRESDRKHKLELEKTVREFEEKSKEELKLAILECERRVREEMKDASQHSVGSRFDSDVSEIGEAKHEKLRKEMEMLKEKLTSEKFELEKKLKQLENERDNEIVKISMRHEEEERKMKENFENEIIRLKSEYQKEMAKLKKESGASNKSDTTVARNLLHALERESEIEKEVTERVKKEMLKMKKEFPQDEMERQVEERVQGGRIQWLKDANEYISNEIKQGVEDRLKEEGEKLQKEWENRLRDEKTKTQKELELQIAKLEREKDEALKMQEQKLWTDWESKKETSERERDDTVKEQVKRKIGIEVANLKKKFVSELEARVMKEKSRLEQEVTAWKDKVRKRMEEERNIMMKRLHSEMEQKMGEEKKMMEAEIKRVQEEEMREMREEMEKEMRMRIQKERKEWEEDRDGEKDRQIWDEAAGEGMNIGLRECLQSEVEARTKACNERDKAVEFIKAREITYREEKQILLAGLKKCREDLEEMKKEHVMLEAKYAEMDRRYKADMKEARRTREQDLALLKLKLEEEKKGLVTSFKARVRDLEGKYKEEVDRVKRDGEMEKASLQVEARRQAEHLVTVAPLQLPDSDSSTILELRDQYLDTVAKIKADVMAHIQEADIRAAATMKAEIRKQRVKVIEIFKVKCKANIRSLLSGQVPVTCITALEHSIDIVSDHLVSTLTTTSSTSRSDNSSKNSNNANYFIDPEHYSSSPQGLTNLYKTKDIIFEKVGESVDIFSVGRSKPVKKIDFVSSPRSDISEDGQTELKEKVYDVCTETRDGKDSQKNLVNESHNKHHESTPHPQLHQQYRRQQPHPQLEKVDLFDTDTFQNTPSSSNNSSPADIILTKSKLKPSKTHVNFPHVPLLSLSPNRNTRNTRTSSAEAKTTSKSVTRSNVGPESSPRDDMKVIEARVRLANWAQSGVMPWKPLKEKFDVDQMSSPNNEELHHKMRKIPSSESREDAQSSDNEMQDTELHVDGCSKGQRKDFSSKNKKLDSDGFVKPVVEAEQWVRSRRMKASSQRSTQIWDENDCPPQGSHYFYREKLRQFSEDSASSTSGNGSFVTLEPEIMESAGSKFQSLDTDSGYRQSSRTNINPESLQGGLRLNSDEKVEGFEFGNGYDRIRAAVFGGGRKHGKGLHKYDTAFSKDDVYREQNFGSAESVSSDFVIFDKPTDLLDGDFWKNWDDFISSRLLCKEFTSSMKSTGPLSGSP